MLYQNGKILVRLIEEKDIPIMTKWLSDPKVLKYYEGRDNPFNCEKVRVKFLNEQKGINRCIIEYMKQEIGYIQFYELNEKSKEDFGYPITERIYGTDQFIGEVEYWNKGIGGLIVQSMTRYVTTILKADRVVMDPQCWNKRAITCYEKCNFKKVKLLPSNEYHEGEYRDCWLMEYNKSRT